MQVCTSQKTLHELKNENGEKIVFDKSFAWSCKNTMLNEMWKGFFTCADFPKQKKDTVMDHFLARYFMIILFTVFDNGSVHRTYDLICHRHIGIKLPQFHLCRAQNSQWCKACWISAVQRLLQILIRSPELKALAEAERQRHDYSAPIECLAMFCTTSDDFA